MPPPSFSTPAIERLNRILEEAGDERFSWPQATKDDWAMFGLYALAFNTIELNMRRSISIFVRTGCYDAKPLKKYSDLPIAALAPALSAAFDDPRLAHEEKEARRMIREIELLRTYRHLPAHWAVRRFPEDDAYLFMSMDGREMKKLGMEAEDDHAATAVLYAADFHGLIPRVGKAEDWLAGKTADWYKAFIG